MTVIVPVRNEEETIGRLVRRVVEQSPPGLELETIVVDNGSTDATAERALEAGARVLHLPLRDGLGNPAAARNLGAAEARGDLLVFLDADCLPEPGWLETLLGTHAQGETIVGGSLDLPAGLSAMARVDYYGGWYHHHSRARGGYLTNLPPGNLSVRRAVFETTSGFVEEGATAYSHEELRWQAEVQGAGHRLRFEPRAIVLHYNRPGFRNLLRRNYRWGYNAIEAKAETGAARMAWIYRYPRTLILVSPLLAVAQTAYILFCWVRVRRLEPLVWLPVLLAARVAYCAGTAVGTARWLTQRRSGGVVSRPRWE